MSRIVEIVKCPDCNSNKVRYEECTMCPLLAEEEAPYYMGNEDLPQTGE